MKTLAPSNASLRSFAVGLLALFFVLTHFALHFHCRGSVALTCRSVAIIGAIGLLGLLLGRQEHIFTGLMLETGFGTLFSNVHGIIVT